MRTLRYLWQALRWPLLAFLAIEAICLVIGCWLLRDRPWNRLKIIGLFMGVSWYAGVLWVFTIAIALLVKIHSAWRQTAKTSKPAVDLDGRYLDGRTPLERLQEEFEAQHPGRLNKEEPPGPVVPPPNGDNPYSYR